MNIVLVTSDFAPAVGGIAGHVRSLAKELARAGDNVCVLHLSRFDTQDETIPLEPYHYVRLRLPDRKLPLLWIKIYLQAIFALVHLRRQWAGIDVIHYHTDKTTALLQTLSSRLPPLSAAIHVWTNHSSVLLEKIRTESVPLWLRLALSTADAMIAPSPELEQLTRAVWGRWAPVDYVPNGVNLDTFYPPPPHDREAWGIPSDSCVILCPRRIVPKNGILTLAEAIPKIHTEIQQSHCLFVFIGMNSVREVAPQYVERVYQSLTQCGDSVLLFDDVPADSMPGLYRASDIIVIPSLIEAVSLAALEAAASARPIIASNVGGLPEVVLDGRTGLLVEPEDSNGLASAILRLVEDPEFRENLGLNGLELAQAYTWTEVARETRRIYDRHFPSASA